MWLLDCSSLGKWGIETKQGLRGWLIGNWSPSKSRFQCCIFVLVCVIPLNPGSLWFTLPRKLSAMRWGNRTWEPTAPCIDFHNHIVPSPWISLLAEFLDSSRFWTHHSQLRILHPMTCQVSFHSYICFETSKMVLPTSLLFLLFYKSMPL